nr:unnamed protein product [Digitaria exilis]
MRPLLLLSLFLAVAANASVAGDDPPPPPSRTPWPEQFHAVVINNLTSSGDEAQMLRVGCKSYVSGSTSS